MAKTPPTIAATPAKTAFCVTAGAAFLPVVEVAAASPGCPASPVLEVLEVLLAWVVFAVAVSEALLDPPLVALAPGEAESLSAPAVMVTGNMDVL